MPGVAESVHQESQGGFNAQRGAGPREEGLGFSSSPGPGKLGSGSHEHEFAERAGKAGVQLAKKQATDH